jgi:Zn-dependent protease with chaperone function
MHFLFVLWVVGVLVVILRLRAWSRLRNVPALVLAIDLPRLPLEAFGHWLDLHYEQSLQGWSSWLWDWTKSELLELVVATLLVSLLYAIIHRRPRDWWVWTWVASLPILAFAFFIEPIAIEPLFFHFEPLARTRPELAQAIEGVIQRGGLAIPQQRIYEMKASEKLKSLNAYVTGIGASKRVVVWDTIVSRMTTPQILFVFGHEMGHYALGHIPKLLAFSAALLLVALWIVQHAMNWAIGRWGKRLGIRSAADRASLPLLLLIFTLLAFAGEPIVNAASRYSEHQADVYAIEVTSGLVPVSARAEVFQILGEVDLAEPDRHPFIEFWLFTHPSISDRMAFAQTH